MNKPIYVRHNRSGYTSMHIPDEMLDIFTVMLSNGNRDVMIADCFDETERAIAQRIYAAWDRALPRLPCTD